MLNWQEMEQHARNPRVNTVLQKVSEIKLNPSQKFEQQMIGISRKKQSKGVLE